MSGYAYPYDPDGTNPQCLVTNETHKLSDYYNPWRCIIPTFAPFYRKDLVVRHKETGRELHEGLDYYLGHSFVDATSNNKQIINGSIFLIHPLEGNILFEQYRTTGGAYNVRKVDILTYLAGEFDDPRNCQWEDVMKFQVPVPPLDTSDSIDEAILKDPVTGALNELVVELHAAFDKTDKTYEAFVTKLESLEDQVVRWEFETHHEIDGNVHGVSHEQARALGINEDAVDALKAYGKSLAELTEFISKQGITSKELDALYENGKDQLAGSLVLRNQNCVVKNGNGTSIVDMESGTITLIAENDIEIVGADDGKGSVSLEAGRNVMTVNPRELDDGNRAGTFNGYLLIHAGNLSNYIRNDSAGAEQMVVQDTPTVRLRGIGTDSEPLVGYVTIPASDSLTKGIFMLSNARGGRSTYKAVTSAVVKQVNNDIEALLLQTNTVNGKPWTGDITLSTQDLSLERVDNTADMDKPVNDNLVNATNNKSLKSHSHDINDITNVPQADASNKGVFQLDLDSSSERTDRAAPVGNIADANDFSERAYSKAMSSLPAGVIDISQYGGFDYLPVPVMGSYQGSGHFNNTRAYHGFVERDGKIIIYRNGYDLDITAVFYAYATIREDGAIVDYVATATQYVPNGLPDGWSIKYCARGSRDGMMVGITNPEGATNWGVVLFNGTGDGTKHSVGLIAGDVNIKDAFPIVHDGKVYIIASNVGEGKGIRHSIVSAPLSEFATFKEVNFTSVAFTGQSAFGDPVNSTDIELVPKDSSDDPTDKAICIRYDHTYSMNPRWNGIGLANCLQGDELRLFIVSGTYEPCSYTNSRGRWSYSVVFNLKDHTFKLDDGNVFPYEFHGKGDYRGVIANVGGQTGMANKGGNVATGEITDYKRTASFATHNESTPGIRGQRFHNDTYFDSLDARNRNVQNAGDYFSTTGNFGSVVGPMQRHVAILPNERLIAHNGNVLCKFTLDYHYKCGKDGYGPTTDRVVAQSRYRDLRHNIYMTDGENEELWGGVLYQERRTSWIRMDDDLVTKHGEVSISEEAYNNLMTEIKEHLATKVDDPSKAIGWTIGSIYVWPDKNIPPMVVSSTLVKWSENDVRTYGVVAELNELPRSGDVGQPTLKKVHVDYIFGHAKFAGTMYSDLPNSCIYRDKASGKMLIVLNTNYPVVYSYNRSTVFMYDPADGSMVKLHDDQRVGYRASGLIATKHYGLLRMYQHDSFTAIIGDQLGKTPEEWEKKELVGEPIVLHSSQLPEGWQIYFTQDMSFFTQKTSYAVPKTTLDLKVLYPNSHQNRTFYIYVEVDGDVGKYVLKDTKVVDTVNSVYIGICETDHKEIVRLEVNNATRIANILDLKEHIEDPNAHGLRDLGKGHFGLDLMENKELKHELFIPTFKEVFNTWQRYSHGTAGTVPMEHHEPGDDQPANPSEMDAWRYEESTDSIVQPHNASTHVGFISPKSMGSYTFDTVVKSDRDDDDSIGVVLGFEVDEQGREHTLTVMRTALPNGKWGAAIIYNFHQTTENRYTRYDNPHTTITTWEKLEQSRIRVERDGDVFKVAIYNFTPAGTLPDTVLAEWVLDLSKHEELAMFRGDSQWGYCTQSQPDATFVNLKRPDEDYKNFYASEQLVYELDKKLDKMKGIVSGVVAHGEKLPLPEGFTKARYICAKQYHDFPVNKPIDMFELVHDYDTRVVSCTIKDELRQITSHPDVAFIGIGIE